ncbi:hypothetical protein BDQ17DRAFT_600044 [Cyathus striatus]|nr:hypothetical protein BDQ17DRAFT_600044 [Cyathus striatus]
MTDDSLTHSNPLSMTENIAASSAHPHLTTLKRRAPEDNIDDDISPKRMKEDQDYVPKSCINDGVTESSELVDGLAQELQCACCSELVYRPVLVMPCQHFFCGSCVVLWVRNGGTNCPACRGESNVVMPFRALQGVIDTFLRAAPHKTRTERERQQADEVYKAGQSLRIPTPRESSPDPPINDSSDYARPCPHCLPGNHHGYTCPQPIPDPTTDLEHAWHMDDGLPPGHGQCGNCENILALVAPSTSKCDMCQVMFCGIGIQGRCVATALAGAQLHGLSDLSDFIQSPAVYDCFGSNAVEVDIMIEYLSAQRLSPREIYQEIVAHIQCEPGGFWRLVQMDLFRDIYDSVPSGVDPGPNAPRNKICRHCATEVFLWGLKGWWVRERRKGSLSGNTFNRKDCPNGINCDCQTDSVHARD